MNQPKPIYASKTVWLNALVAIVALWDQVQPFIPPKFVPYGVAAVGIANILLRLLTNQPLTVSKKREG